MAKYNNLKKLKSELEKIFNDNETYGDCTSLNNIDTIKRKLKEIKYKRNITDEEKEKYLIEKLKEILNFISTPDSGSFRFEIKSDINDLISELKLKEIFKLFSN